MLHCLVNQSAGVVYGGSSQVEQTKNISFFLEQSVGYADIRTIDWRAGAHVWCNT